MHIRSTIIVGPANFLQESEKHIYLRTQTEMNILLEAECENNEFCR